MHEIGVRLRDALPYTILTEKPTGNSKVTYYINYAQAPKKRVGGIECALFTHIEELNPKLVEKWQETAENMDIAVCMSKIYSRKLRKIVTSVVIPPGVDLKKFTLNPIEIGVIGRSYKSGRKGDQLIKSVIGIEGINWNFTGEGWPTTSKFLDNKDIPKLYKKLDYVLVASLYEGGPMSVVEALACGVKVIGPDVGWIPELPHISFKLGDERSLGRTLEKLVYERRALRESVLDRSWDNFIKKHDYLFRNLLELEDNELNNKRIKKIVSGIDEI